MNSKYERRDWYPTTTGADIYVEEPWLSEVRIEDIAHALSLQCRFGGHILAHYSVAQHCVLMSRLCSPKHALVALLHDASEAYVQDIIGPQKHLHRKTYGPLEHVWLERIGVQFGVDLVDLPSEIKLIDKQMLLAERRALLPADGWTIPGVEPADVKIYPWTSGSAKSLFLARFQELTDRTIIIPGDVP